MQEDSPGSTDMIKQISSLLPIEQPFIFVNVIYKNLDQDTDTEPRNLCIYRW